MATKSWEETPAGMAAMFGWSQSVLNSNPELKKLFNQATSEQWTPDHFIAKVRDTKWFKKTSDTARQALILQKADPATFNQRVGALGSQILSMAQQMGTQGMTSATINKLAHDALVFGWDNTEIQQHLFGFVKANKWGYYTGQAGQSADAFKQLATQYGVDVAPATLQRFVTGAVKGAESEATFKQWLIGQASSRYPSLSDRLKAGESLMDIANPYFQSYAQTLEVNPNSISLKDPLIQAALSGKDKNGKPSTKTLWQFENDLRNDPRYMQTQQAQDKTMAVGHQVLRDFGFMGN